MGGCASKPKEFENRPNSAPADHEAPASPKKAEQPEAAVQEKGNGGENNNNKNENENENAEAPLVDLSEPKKEAEESSSKTTSKDAKTEDNKTDQEPEVTAEITDQKKVEAVVLGVEPTDKAKADKSDAPTSSAGKDKTDAPLDTV